MKFQTENIVRLKRDGYGCTAGEQFIVVTDIPAHLNPDEVWIISRQDLQRQTDLPFCYGYVELAYLEDTEQEFELAPLSALITPPLPSYAFPAPAPQDEPSAAPVVRNKYMREIAPGVWVDVYDVLYAFDVTDPCLQHLIKKALATGVRGHKSTREDLVDIKDSAIRAVEHYDKFNK